MEKIVDRAIELNVPLRTVYDQWTQFEEFSKFMEGVKSVKQTDDTHLHWCAEIGGRTIEWDAEITEQIPDNRIAWRSISGAPNSGIVEFTAIDPGRTRMRVWMEYAPHELVEEIGATLGIVTRRVDDELDRFKQFIESRGTETGAWRGEVHDEDADHEAGLHGGGGGAGTHG